MSAFGLAWSFNALGPGPVAGRLVGVHRTVGLTILGLTVLRLVWRILAPLPSLPPTPVWEIRLARSVQAVLYVMLLLQPLLGWAASSAQGDAVTYLGLVTLPDIVEMDETKADTISRLHEFTGFAILALVTLHVAGALRHGLVRRDGVLRRMVTGRPG